MKKAFLFVAFLFSIKIVAQTITFNHQYAWNYPFKVLTSVLPTDSCYYATGVITDTTNNSYKIGNIFTKMDLQGEMVFTKTILSTSKFYETWLGDLTPLENGGFLDIGLVKDSTIKGVIIKYDAVGDTVFTREFLHPYYPDESFLYLGGVKIDDNKNIIILGGMDGDTSEVSNMDIFITKFDSLGNLYSTQIIGGFDTETPVGMLLEPDGSMIIGSNKANTGFVNQNFRSRAHILQVDSLGSIQWEYITPFGLLFNRVRDIVKTPDGGLVAASGKGIEHVVNSTSGQLRWFPYMFKLDSNHNLEWGREFRGTQPSIISFFDKIVAASDGSGFVGVGTIAENVSIGEEVYGSWLVKTSPEGDSLWARYYSFFDGVKVRPTPYDLKNTPDGGYVIVGETSPENPDSIITRAWMLKVDEYGCLIPGCQLVDDTEQLSNAAMTIAIYPNPSSDFLNFQLRNRTSTKVATFRIINAQGQVMRTIQTNHPSDTNILSIQDWPDGTYFLQYWEDNSILHTESFVKQ